MKTNLYYSYREHKITKQNNNKGSEPNQQIRKLIQYLYLFFNTFKI